MIMQHDQFQNLLDSLVKSSGVGQQVLGEVLARTSLRAPEETSRLELSAGNPFAHRATDQGGIPQGTISKAVKALIDEGLLEDGKTFMRTPEGRPLAPLRFGSTYAVAGVKVMLSREQPRQVATALLGLDNSRVLGTAQDTADSWDQVADLVHRRVTSLKETCDQARASRGLPPLRIFGVGVEVGAPVHNGQVMPLRADGRPVPLAEKLHLLFEADTSFPWDIPVMVENNVNALAVLSTHQIHYTDPDFVLVGVFDEEVGGGLVMDGRLRRGSNGRAMQIGHLAVGFPPGHEPELLIAENEATQPSHALDGFRTRCSCGRYGHVDTLATPLRIQEEFGNATLDQISAMEPPDPQFHRASEIFRRAGAALGSALAHVSSTVNPRRIILYLPASLAEPKRDTAAAVYLTALRAEATRAFGASNEPDYLSIRSFPAEPQEAALLGARAAAACVLESFIEHALRLDGCRTGSRRGAADSHILAKGLLA
jgi:predicted NBD/HSP70 family sugar kinase